MIHRITFITPLFSKGSYDDRPEIRPASIRGQLHWWFRALGHDHKDEKAVFGSVHNGTSASKIVVRVSNITEKPGQANTLPHKYGGEASPKAAFLPGTSFDLWITERLGGLNERLRAAFLRTLEAWLLLGTLGLRATRAAGSFVWEPQADSPLVPSPDLSAYACRVKEVLANTPLQATIIPQPFDSAEEARRVVSDTIGKAKGHSAPDPLLKYNHPLGKIHGSRKTSPLRFRIIQVGGSHHIVAVWDGRSNITGNSPKDRDGVIRLLVEKDKKIGHLLLQHPFA